MKMLTEIIRLYSKFKGGNFMDTIEISLILDDIDILKLQILRSKISNLTSPSGHTFVDVLEFSRAGNLILKISYPRYFTGTNVYLIRSREECFRVQNYFCKKILENKEWEKYIVGIKLLRVDIPFIFIMDRGFYSYKNIFYIFAHVYNIKKTKAKSKGFLDLITDEFETIIYSSNGSSRKDCGNKLEIYNQYKNLKEKVKEEIFIRINKDYPDFKKRMRLEVSKRINLRVLFSIEDFKNLDILGKYFYDYKKYILDNVLDPSIIENLYNQWVEELTHKLNEEKYSKNFSYEIFILQNIRNLYDYEIIRRTLKNSISNKSTRENAITKVRKILREFEVKNGIMVLNIYSTLVKMYDSINECDLLDKFYTIR